MAASNVDPFPPYWTTKESHPKQTKVVDVDAQTVNAIVKSTWDPDKVGRGRDAKELDHDDIIVTRVQRVENKKLFLEFNQKRDEFLQISRQQKYRSISGVPPKLDGFKSPYRELSVNEYYLFHGTSDEAAKKIVINGFNPGKADPKSMFGKGIYFAEEFTKADQYSDEIYEREPEGEELTILLCRVVLGNAFKSGRSEAESWKSPPCIKCKQEECSCSPPKKYDSVLGAGNTMMFREFVVFKREQCYPEFIIAYRRVANKIKAGRRIQGEHVKFIERIIANHVGRPNHSPVSKLYEFYHKTKIQPPEYKFKINSPGGPWNCDLDFYPLTASGQAQRKKIAKRNAASEVWDILTKSL